MNLQELKQTAQAYEDLLVPALFQGWAHQMVNLIPLQSNQRVLDVACGTGILTRTIFEKLGGEVDLIGLDLNPGMLAVAKEINQMIDWVEGRAEELPFQDDHFDVVISQFGLMLFESPQRAIHEMVRVLKPGGNVMLVVFDDLEQNRAYKVMSEVFAKVVSPDVGKALQFPFSLGKEDQLRPLFDLPGLVDLSIKNHTQNVHFETPKHMVLSDVKGWFPFADIHLDQSTIQSVIEEATVALQPFSTSDGVDFKASIQVISAKKSH